MTTMEDPQLHSHSFMPLLSRVDRLDSVMRYIEKKEKLSRWRSHGSCTSIGIKDNRQVMPLSATAREANSKGSLMDRILSLEDRLAQLSREIESSSRASSSSSRQGTCSSLWTTSSSSYTGGVKSELLPVSSYPTFTHPINPKRKLQSQVLTSVHEEFQKKSQGVQQRLKHPSVHIKKQNGKDEDEEIMSKSGKKKRSFSWPRLKLLGC